MGYRSNVVYFIKFYDDDAPEKAHADFVRFHEWVKQFVIEDTETYGLENVEREVNDSINADFHIIVSESCVTFKASNVKWYEDYPEVRWHAELLQKVPEFKTGNYLYYRVGEDPADIENNYHMNTYMELYNHIEVSTNIETNFPSPDPETEDKE